MDQFDFDESGEKILSVSCYEEEINATGNPSNKIQTKSLLAIMKIGGKNVKMLIDLGAYAYDVLLIKYLRKGAVSGWKMESHPQDVLKVNHVSAPLVKQKYP